MSLNVNFLSGTKHGYHPLTFAMYLDQIVRKVDPQGRSLSQYFDEEIAKPFGSYNYDFLHKTFFPNILICPQI